MAYSLIGILCLNMTPMYGEGKDEAFMRLNVEIEKRLQILPKKNWFNANTDKERSVSGTHFEIYYNWESIVLMIRNLSSNGLTIKAGKRNIINQGDKRALCQVDCSIDVGLLTFGLEIPDRGQLQSLYGDNLEVYRKIVKEAVPNMASLAVEQRGKYTPAVEGLLATSTSTPTNKYYCRWKIGEGSTSTVHITRYIEVVENQSLSLVIEFVGGGSLTNLQNVSRRETLLMAQQTSQALSYFHDQSITHRDIKPANILIVSRGRDFHCKVADFGESSEDESILTTSCGTLLYQAPEITEPHSKVVDIWSLGVTIAQDMLGTLKWTAPGMTRWHSLLHQKLKEEKERDCRMADILLHMLEVDPVKRYSASQSRYHLDNLPLPDELGTRSEPPGPHKRGADLAELDVPNADLAELDVPNASRRFRCNSEHSTIGPVPLRAISEEPLETGGSQYQPQVSKAAPLRDPPGDIAPSPKRSKRLETPKETSLCQREQIVRLDPQSREINATDIFKATGKKKVTKAIDRFVHRTTRTSTHISFDDGEEFIRYLNMPESSATTLLQVIEQNQLQATVPITSTVIKPDFKQAGGVPAAKLGSSTPNPVGQEGTVSDEVGMKKEMKRVESPGT
ncbi:kinase-like protein [Acephala macrosclerotiorum]|nr:kinase-like protein [Acephala macrosclerotiorum]